MNIFSNHKSFGGDFGKEFIQNLKSSNSLVIASGYFGTSLIKSLQPDLLNIAHRGFCKILIGMIFNEGVSAEQKLRIEELDQNLKNINSNSGVFVSLSQYHGKIYKFSSAIDEKIYVGSSNFSDSGFKTNYEFNALITDQVTKDSVSDFLDYFLDPNSKLTAPLNKVSLNIKGKKQSSSSGKTSTELTQYLIASNQFPTIPSVSTVKIKLRPDEQPKSSLNLYFETGRKSKSGKYEPRPWYEIEITAQIPETKQNDYPVGEFTAYIKDSVNNLFYELPMITASDNNKAITSKGNRKLLGEIIKDKLEQLGHLEKYQRITSDTLSSYGRDYIELKKFDDKKYYFDF